MEEINISKKRKWTSSFKKFVHHNKIITITAIVFTMCFVLNMVLVLNFMKLLGSI